MNDKQKYTIQGLEEYIRQGEPQQRKDVPVNVPNLATILGVSEKTIKRDLAAMQSAGFIKRVGSDKTGHWEISN